MFKKEKDLAERSRALLKNKETKRLKADILSKFPRLTEDDLDAIVLKEQFTRVVLANRSIVYSIGPVPYFIDHEGRNDFYPTVFLLWRCPHALRSFVIHAPVSTFVMKGAALLMPGLATLSGLEGLSKGEKMSVRVWGNPSPFAVGLSQINWEIIEMGGRRGVALEVSMRYGDFLNPLGGVGNAHPNNGFGATSISILEGFDDQSMVDSEDEDEDEEDDCDEGGGEEVEGASEGKAFAGGDGKFTYIGALKGSHLGKGKAKKKGTGKGEGEKKDVPLMGSGVDKGIAALSDFPPLSVSSPSLSDAASVAAVSAQSNVDKSENDTESRDVADLLSAVRLEDGEERSHDIEEQGGGDGDNDDEGSEEEGGSENEREVDKGEESDVEDDISRYQREIEERHKEKEAQAHRDVSQVSSGGGSTVQAVDSAIESALLKAIKYVIKDKQLPMLVAIFWGVVQKCSDDGDDADVEGGDEGERDDEGGMPSRLFDIRQSSHKKVSTFLSLGLLTVVEANGVASITMVQRQHNMFRGIKVQDPEALREGTRTNSTDKKKGGKIAVLELFKMPKNLVEIFGPIKSEYGVHMRAGDFRDAFSAYSKKNGLEMDAHEDGRAPTPTPGPAVRIDRSCVIVPPSDPLYQIALKVFTSNSKNLASTSSSTSSSSSAPGGSKSVLKSGTSSSTSITKECSASKVTSSSVGRRVSFETSEDRGEEGEDGGEEQEEEDWGEGGGEGGTGQTVGGVWMPKLGGGGAWGATSLNSSSSSNSSRGQIPESGPGSAKSVWRPVSLPPSVPLSVPKGLSSGVKGSGHPTDSKTINKKREEKMAVKLAAVVAAKEKLPDAPVTVKKDDMVKALMKLLSPYSAVVATDGSYNICSGRVPSVEIHVEVRRGNKLVTHLRRLEVFGFDLSSLCKELQKKFASSASVGLIPGMLADKEIIIQGNLAAEVESYLVDTYDLPKHLIGSTVLKGVKPKKK